MFLSEWYEFTSVSCLTEKKNSMTARVSIVETARVPHFSSDSIQQLPWKSCIYFHEYILRRFLSNYPNISNTPHSAPVLLYLPHPVLSYYSTIFTHIGTCRQILLKKKQIMDSYGKSAQWNRTDTF
jgi:hypothetical protein